VELGMAVRSKALSADILNLSKEEDVEKPCRNRATVAVLLPGGIFHLKKKRSAHQLLYFVQYDVPMALRPDANPADVLRHCRYA